MIFLVDQCFNLNNFMITFALQMKTGLRISILFMNRKLKKYWLKKNPYLPVWSQKHLKFTNTFFSSSVLWILCIIMVSFHCKLLHVCKESPLPCCCFQLQSGPRTHEADELHNHLKRQLLQKELLTQISYLTQIVMDLAMFTSETTVITEMQHCLLLSLGLAFCSSGCYWGWFEFPS